MLLTLATRSFANVLSAAPGDAGEMSVLDLPDYAVNQLCLRGLNVGASILAGWSLEDLDKLRDRRVAEWRSAATANDRSSMDAIALARYHNRADTAHDQS